MPTRKRSTRRNRKSYKRISRSRRTRTRRKSLKRMRGGVLGCVKGRSRNKTPKGADLEISKNKKKLRDMERQHLLAVTEATILQEEATRLKEEATRVQEKADKESLEAERLRATMWDPLRDPIAVVPPAGGVYANAECAPATEPLPAVFPEPQYGENYKREMMPNTQGLPETKDVCREYRRDDL